MSYKFKSLLYLLALVVSAFIYHTMNEVSTKEAKVVSTTEMDSAHTAANADMSEEEAMLLK